MTQAFLISGSAALASGFFFIGAAVLMQEVRSRLVAVLIDQKSPLSMELSDWTVSGGRLPGNYGAIRREFIWGPPSIELAGNPLTAPMVRTARVLYVVREAARYCGLVSLAWFLWAGLTSAQ